MKTLGRCPCPSVIPPFFWLASLLSVLRWIPCLKAWGLRLERVRKSPECLRSVSGVWSHAAASAISAGQSTGRRCRIAS